MTDKSRLKLACWYWVTPSYVKLKNLSVENPLNIIENELARVWKTSEYSEWVTYFRTNFTYFDVLAPSAYTIPEAMEMIEGIAREHGYRIVDSKYKALL